MPALKYSRQREAIKCFLMTRKDHPTADVVYHSLRADFPNIRETRNAHHDAHWH